MAFCKAKCHQTMEVDMNIEIPKSLVALKALTPENLNELWMRYFHAGKPQIKPLWYKIQCELSGIKLAQKHITKLNLYSVDPNKCVANANNTKYHIKPGTQLLKKFKGNEHVVTVIAPDQFEYSGTTYKSLSAIATLICGHKVSGYDFFLRIFQDTNNNKNPE